MFCLAKDTFIDVIGYLSPNDLRHLSCVDKRMNTLFQEEEIWKRHIVARLSPCYHTKPTILSWRQWDNFWTDKRIRDPVNHSLHLSPLEGYKRLIVVEGGVIQGAELYCDSLLLLTRAFALGDIEMIAYFMDIYRHRIDMPEDENLLVAAYTFLDDIRRREGKESNTGKKISCYIAEILPRYLSETGGDIGCKLEMRLGELGEVDVYEDITHYTFSDDEEDWATEREDPIDCDYFLEGLISGGHEAKAIEYCQNINTNATRLYALASEKGMTKLQSRMFYYHHIDIEVARYYVGEIDDKKKLPCIISPYEICKIYISRGDYSRAVTYFKDNWESMCMNGFHTNQLDILEFIYGKIHILGSYIDIEHCSTETILTVMSWMKGSSEYASLLHRIISIPRYDIIREISAEDIRNSCLTDPRIFSTLRYSSSPDIFLYLLLIIHQDDIKRIITDIKVNEPPYIINYVRQILSTSFSTSI